MNNELVTVIIPTYNRAKLINRAINSVLNQTYNNIELIIIDDASEDNTEEIVKSINDDRITYIKLEVNKGACNARNIGIKEAKGKYITFQDSDDEYHKDKIEKQLNNLINNNSDLDFCKIEIINNDKHFVFPNEKQRKSISNNKILDELCNGNFISTQAIFVKTDCIKKYLFDPEMPRLQDYDLVLRMVPKIKISYTDEILVDLYTQTDSISNSPEKLKNSIVLFLKKQYDLNDQQKTTLINYLLNSNPDNSLKYEELYNNFIVLKNNYERLNYDYQNIVNSRRWKIADNICNKIKK